MRSNKKIAVVIPCYRVSRHIKEVILSIPAFVDHILVVDDACPEYSGAIADEIGEQRVRVIFHEKNKGVGGAVISGFLKAVELGCDIVIKMDGDGQMDANQIPILILPLLAEQADYTKGNRFHDFTALKSMPKIRLLGNSVLSFVVKATSGYWNLMDPTNGFCAISYPALCELKLDKIDKGYFFETDMLIHLNLINKVVMDVPIAAIYGNEISNLRIRNVLFSFAIKAWKGLLKRIFYKYYIYDFNMASIYFLIAIPLLVFGLAFGGYRWNMGILENSENNAGTIMLAALPIILGIQFLLQAINIDISSIPKKSADSYRSDHIMSFANKKRSEKSFSS
ncbi:glycosyltransferase family 2 protein [Poritiphilus flavus]|nr:glycosyltransferase family 2 protein [Poritiphilus flavus]